MLSLSRIRTGLGKADDSESSSFKARPLMLEMPEHNDEK
jgi:hypothetical protein